MLVSGRVYHKISRRCGNPPMCQAPFTGQWSCRDVHRPLVTWSSSAWKKAAQLREEMQQSFLRTTLPGRPLTVRARGNRATCRGENTFFDGAPKKNSNLVIQHLRFEEFVVVFLSKDFSHFFGGGREPISDIRRNQKHDAGFQVSTSSTV